MNNIKITGRLPIQKYSNTENTLLLVHVKINIDRNNSEKLVMITGRTRRVGNNHIIHIVQDVDLESL